MPGLRQPIFSYDTVFTEIYLSDADIDKLLAELSSSDTEIREKAERFYSEHQADILPLFFNAYDRIVILGEKVRRIQKIIFPVFFLAVATILPFILWRSNIAFSFPFWMIYILIPAYSLYLSFELTKRTKPEPAELMLIKIISETDQPQYVGSLIEGFTNAGITIQQILEPMMFRQLKLLTDSSSLTLTTTQARYLCRHLYRIGFHPLSPAEEEQALLILKAVDQVKHDEGYNVVEQIVKHGHFIAILEPAQAFLHAVELRQQRP